MNPRDTRTQRDARTNRRIKAREVRVIGSDGSQLGVLPTDQAMARAQAEGMDLVEISPMAKPPVCKIMDYGKFKYLEKKKQNEAKKKQVVVQLKEVKLRPRTEEHDFAVKIRKIREFLEEANKARVTVTYRGREMSHRELGQKVLQRVIDESREYAVIESAPRMEGRQLFMILAPNPKMLQRLRAQAQSKAGAAASAPPPPPPSGGGTPPPAAVEDQAEEPAAIPVPEGELAPAK